MTAVKTADVWESWFGDCTRKINRLDFRILCGHYLLDPDEALERENLVAAIKANDRAEIKRIFEEEF